MTMAPAVARLSEKAAGCAPDAGSAPPAPGTARRVRGRAHRPRAAGVESSAVRAPLEDLDPDQAAAFRQFEIGEAPPMIEREGGSRPSRCRGGSRMRGLVGADGEHEARAEGMRRAQQIAEIDGLGDALDADGEIAARGAEVGFSQVLSATSWAERKRASQSVNERRQADARCAIQRIWRASGTSPRGGGRAAPRPRRCPDQGDGGRPQFLRHAAAAQPIPGDPAASVLAWSGDRRHASKLSAPASPISSWGRGWSPSSAAMAAARRS